MKENSICGDNRFEIIEKAKEMLLNATNIEDSKEEMKVLTNILFRMWQAGLINEEKLEINKLQKENSIEEDIELLQDETSSLGLFFKCKCSEKYKIALEHLIKAYKELEEENKDLKNLANNKQWISPCYVAQNYIPVSLVEEKIEELNKKERQELKGLKGQDRYFVKQMYQYKRSVLQELLEGRK